MLLGETMGTVLQLYSVPQLLSVPAYSFKALRLPLLAKVPRSCKDFGH